MAKLGVALQIDNLCDDLAKDFVGTLKSVASLGYRGVEQDASSRPILESVAISMRRLKEWGKT